MAIHQHRRENLVAEATAYRRRALLCLPGLKFRGAGIEELFIGQRGSGAWSLYLDETPVLQFNSQGALRRLHIQGQLYVAELGRLVQLKRDSQGGKILSDRIPMEETQQSELLAELSALVGGIVAKMSQELKPSRLKDHYPKMDSEIVASCAAWLNELPSMLNVAVSPNALA